MFIATIIGFICLPKMKPNYLRIFLIWLVILCLSEIILFLFNDLFSDSKLIYIVYCSIFFFEYLIYCYIFYKRMNISKGLKYYLITTLTFYFFYSVYVLLFLSNEKNSAGNNFVIVSTLLIILMLIYFWQIISSNDVIKLPREPLFWIATGTLFFCTGNVVATGFFHRLYDASHELAKLLYKLNHILAIALYVLCSIAFILSTKKELKDV